MGSLAHTTLPHPFDPLSLEEIQTAVSAVRKAHGDVKFNVVSLHEPRKAEMTAWLEAPDRAPRPARVADIVVVAPGSKVYDGLVDIASAKIIKWEHVEGVQPIVSPLYTSPSVERKGCVFVLTGAPNRSQWRNSS